MKQLVKPRMMPLFGWLLLLATGFFCTYVLYSRPTIFLPKGSTPLSAATETDSVEQAMVKLSAIKASLGPQNGMERASGDEMEIIAPAPPPAPAPVFGETKTNTSLNSVDMPLKGAVIVHSGKRLYLVLGSKRFRAGDRIATGETVGSLNLQTVELISPDGRTRMVGIGRGIGPSAN